MGNTKNLKVTIDIMTDNTLIKVFRSTLIKSTGIYTITNIINAAIPFILLPVLTRNLSPSEYGLVSMFTVLVSLVSPFIGMSVQSAITRQYYKKNRVDFSAYIYNCLLVLLVSMVVVFLVFYFLSDVIYKYTKFPKELLWTIILFSASSFVINIRLSVWQVEKQSTKYGFFNISQSLTNVLLSLFLVIVLSLSWEGRVFGQLFARMLFALFAIFSLIKNQLISKKHNKEYIKHSLSVGSPLILHTLSGSILNITDRVFITNMVGLSIMGIYSVGYQIGSIVNLLAISFNNAYVPWLYEKLNKNSTSENKLIVKVTYLYNITILIFSMLLGILSSLFIGWFLGNDYSSAGSFVVWITVGYAFNGMYFMVVNYLFYVEKTNELATVTFLTSILNVILNYYFIKAFGAVGAAQATAITFFVKFIFVWIVSSKVYKMPWLFFIHKKL